MAHASFMDLEELAELTSRLVLENSTWNEFVGSAVERILARQETTDIDKLIETMQKFIRQEIKYPELMSQVDQPIAEILKEAVSVYKRVCHKGTPEERVKRIILKKPSKPTELVPPEKEIRATRTTTKGTQRLRRPAQLWTAEESERLREIMSRQSIDRIEWTAVSQQLGTGRTSAQCAQHWCRVLNPDLQKRDWRIDEDGDLLELYEVHQTKWAVIASLIKGRSDTQCRNRYIKLKASIKRPWLESEDTELFACREQNMSWEEISQRLYTTSPTKKVLMRYPIVCKMRYKELTGIDTDYEEIGIGEGARNSATLPVVEMNASSEIPLNKC